MNIFELTITNLYNLINERVSVLIFVVVLYACHKTENLI